MQVFIVVYFSILIMSRPIYILLKAGDNLFTKKYKYIISRRQSRYKKES